MKDRVVLRVRSVKDAARLKYLLEREREWKYLTIGSLRDYCESESFFGLPELKRSLRQWMVFLRCMMYNLGARKVIIANTPAGKAGYTIIAFIMRPWNARLWLYPEDTEVYIGGMYKVYANVDVDIAPYMITVIAKPK